MGTSWRVGDQRSSGSERVSPQGNPWALGKERRKNCSVQLNNMFSQLLRLHKGESGQGTVPGLSGEGSPSARLTIHCTASPPGDGSN